MADVIDVDFKKKEVRLKFSQQEDAVLVLDKHLTKAMDQIVKMSSDAQFNEQCFRALFSVLIAVKSKVDGHS